MASNVNGVWAIDIGTNSLKALRLQSAGDGLEVIDFDYIEHKKILSGSNVSAEQRQEIINDAINEFIANHNLGKEEVAISVAGHSSFARFIKLPPVDPKKIPQIVQFEAVQQIPFDINEVEWDWQLMEDTGSSEAEVGIFAIKNEIVSNIMEPFSKANMKVACVQISPMALYNYAVYDRRDIGGINEPATLLLDMGAENTTLVVCTNKTVWQRSIRIGGNAFTQAIADTFKLKFQKAEKLKRTAPMSKYVRQIFTAMRPVFTDLGSEIQRSLGFYSSSGPGGERGFSKVIAMGGGMKLQGLSKYLQQTLGIPVIKPDSFEKLKLSPDISSAKFHENLSDFGIVYGLTLQLLNQSKIKINLLPRKIARAMAWARKGKMFTLAASILLVASLISFANVIRNKSAYKGGQQARASFKRVINKANDLSKKLQKQQDREKPLEAEIQKEMEKFNYRDVVPLLNEIILSCLPDAEKNPDQAELYSAFEAGDVEKVLTFSRHERKQLFVTSISVNYAPSVENASFEKATSRSFGSRNRRSSTQGYGSEMMGEMMPTRRSVSTRPGMSPIRRPGVPGIPGAAVGTQDEEDTQKDGPGFIVIIEGYSPYEQAKDLLDPVGVGDDTAQWGFATRLKNLDSLFEGCKFELYGKEDISHFQCISGDVEFGAPDTPVGLGIEKLVQRIKPEDDLTQKDRIMAPMRTQTLRYGTGRNQDLIQEEWVLIDPMTKEEMSKIYDIYTEEDIANDPLLTDDKLGTIKRDKLTNEPQFIVRDQWFKIHAKFLWKDAPKSESLQAPGMQGIRGRPVM